MSWGYVIDTKGSARAIAALWTSGDALHYVAADGAREAMCIQPAWCERCRAFGFAERFTSEAEVTRDARSDFEARHGVPDTEFLREALRQQVQLRLARFRYAINVAQSRASGPKCLACGSERIQRVPETEDVSSAYVATAVLGDAASHLAGSYSPTGDRMER